MDKKTEAELFAFLSKQTKLREWLNHKGRADMEVLMLNNDIDQIRRAQGRLQMNKMMVDLMVEP